MKLPKFDHTHRQLAWDRYNAFHVKHYDRHGVEIVQFDTGEMLVRVHGSRPDPDGRKQHVDRGIRIATTANDDGCPSLQMTDGTLVPATWYGGAAQTLLIDDHSGHVVGIGGSYSIPYDPEYHLRQQKHVDYAISNGIPERFAELSGGLAWFAGNGRIPVSNRPIALYRPIIHPLEVWRQAREYRTAALAWMAMEGQPTKVSSYDRPSPREVLEVVKYPTFGDMPPIERTKLALGGLTSGTTSMIVSSLRVAPPTTMPRTTSDEDETAQRLRDEA